MARVALLTSQQCIRMALGMRAVATGLTLGYTAWTIRTLLRLPYTMKRIARLTCIPVDTAPLTECGSGRLRETLVGARCQESRGSYPRESRVMHRDDDDVRSVECTGFGRRYALDAVRRLSCARRCGSPTLNGHVSLTLCSIVRSTSLNVLVHHRNEPELCPLRIHNVSHV